MGHAPLFLSSQSQPSQTCPNQPELNSPKQKQKQKQEESAATGYDDEQLLTYADLPKCCSRTPTYPNSATRWRWCSRSPCRWTPFHGGYSGDGSTTGAVCTTPLLRKAMIAMIARCESLHGFLLLYPFKAEHPAQKFNQPHFSVFCEQYAQGSTSQAVIKVDISDHPILLRT
jgi:hypothetical protein